MKDYILGMDMGGTRLKAAVLDTDFKIQKTFYCNKNTDKNTRDMSTYEWKQIINTHLNQLKAEYGANPISFGISTPGIPNKLHTKIGHMPKRLTEIQDLNWSALLDFQKQIYILNDAKAAFIAELQTDALRNTKNVFMLTLGTGVGGAAMVDGIILEGHLGRAGHLGNISVDMDGRQALTNIPGGLDNLIGNCQIEDRTYGLYSDPIQLEKDYEAGNTIATEYWLKMVKALAVGIASLINVLDPEIIVIGGGISNAEDNLFKPLADYLTMYEWRPYGDPIPIIKAIQGDFSGAIGAAIYAYRQQ